MDTPIRATHTASQLAAAVEEAASLLQRGELVALPTETVYGLAADALRPEAALKIFEAKERPFFDPLIVHLPTRDWLEEVAFFIDETSPRLADAFWPGPLTLVLSRRLAVPDVVTAGLATVAVRMSAHPVFRAVIERLGRPLAAPSANRFGRISPTAAAHVVAELNGRIPLVLDGGATKFGVESTVVSTDGDEITIWRSGPITPDQLAEFGKVIFAKPNAETPNAPGRLPSHYAPRTRLCLADADLRIAENYGARVGLLAWRKPSAHAGFAAMEVLSESGDLREAAATLFAKMRSLDDAGLDLILAEPVPEHGLGIAIMDRLRRASAQPL